MGNEGMWVTRVSRQDHARNVTGFLPSTRGICSLSLFCKGKAETGQETTKTQGERQYRDEPWDSRQYRANSKIGIG